MLSSWSSAQWNTPRSGPVNLPGYLPSATTWPSTVLPSTRMAWSSSMNRFTILNSVMWSRSTLKNDVT
jgi:hypothetical protein